MPENSLMTVLPNPSYQVLRTQTGAWTKNTFRKSLNTAELTQLESSKGYQRPPMNGDEAACERFLARAAYRNDMSKRLMRKQYREAHMSNPTGTLSAVKAGVSTATGYNFIDLRGPAVLAYPVNTPIRNMLPREGKVNAGFGTMAQWKTNKNPGYVYGGAQEGQRAQVGTPDMTNYFAEYAELGHERSVTFTAQWAGEGYTDNMADEHTRGLNVVFLQEESMMLNGNSGSAAGHNGFTFGTAATPALAVALTNTVVAPIGPTGYLCSGTGALGCLPFTAAFTTASTVSVAVVVLSGMGNAANAQYGYQAAPTIASGLTPTYTYNAPGSGTSVTVNGGCSAISLSSAVLSPTTSNLTIKASIAPVKGAFGYAWYVNTTDASGPSLSNAKLAGITTSPIAYLSGTATGTQTGNASGLNSDHSSNLTDFEGLLTFAATSGYWVDLQGATLTSQKNGRVGEIETMLQFLFANYQVTPTRFWVSPDVAVSLDSAVRWTGTGTAGTFSGFQFLVNRDQQNNILGGFVVSGYQSRFAVMNPTGATVIPISIHPMIPPGTLFADFETNPYPTSRAPFSRGMDVQREYYGIEWPLIQRAWPWGTYVHETLAHYYPWLCCVITGIGPFVGN